MGNHNKALRCSGVHTMGNHNFIGKEIKKEKLKEIKVIEEKKSRLPEDVQEAIDIRNEAMKIQKEVIEKTNYIEKRKRDYYKKYGKWYDKAKAYLQSFYK